MVSEVEPMAKNTIGFFENFHNVFTLTCSAYNKADTDIPSSFATKNNSKGEGNIGFVQEAFSMVCDCCSGYFHIYGVYTLIYFLCILYYFWAQRRLG